MCYSELEAEKAKGARGERPTDTFSLAGEAGVCQLGLGDPFTR